MLILMYPPYLWLHHQALRCLISRQSLGQLLHRWGRQVPPEVQAKLEVFPEPLGALRPPFLFTSLFFSVQSILTARQQALAHVLASARRLPDFAAVGLVCVSSCDFWDESLVALDVAQHEVLPLGLQAQFALETLETGLLFFELLEGEDLVEEGGREEGDFGLEAVDEVVFVLLGLGLLGLLQEALVQVEQVDLARVVQHEVQVHTLYQLALFLLKNVEEIANVVVAFIAHGLICYILAFNVSIGEMSDFQQVIVVLLVVQAIAAYQVVQSLSLPLLLVRQGLRHGLSQLLRLLRHPAPLFI